MQNALKSNASRRIWVLEIFKIEIQKGGGGPNNSSILQNWLTPKIRSPVSNLEIFQKSQKVSPESCRMHRNLMNDEELRFLKLSKLKYRRGHQIIQPF